MKIGVVAVQGAYEAHQTMLARMKIDSLPLRAAEDFQQPFDGLILPGGDCDKQSKLLQKLGMLEPIRALIHSGMPVLGTCSGLVLLAKQLEGGKVPYYLGTMPITARRHFFPSLQTSGAFGAIRSIPMRFTNAPVITDLEEGVEILSLTQGEITAARYQNQLVTSFHPELTTDPSVHHYFMIMVELWRKSQARQ